MFILWNFEINRSLVLHFVVGLNFTRAYWDFEWNILYWYSEDDKALFHSQSLKINFLSFFRIIRVILHFLFPYYFPLFFLYETLYICKKRILHYKEMKRKSITKNIIIEIQISYRCLLYQCMCNVYLNICINVILYV